MPEPKSLEKGAMQADVFGAEKMFKADIYLSTFSINDHLLLKTNSRS